MVDIHKKAKFKPKTRVKLEKNTEMPPEDDFVLKGKSAEKFYQKLIDPPQNPAREQFTQEALQRFPDPSKPTIITLKLKDE